MRLMFYLDGGLVSSVSKTYDVLFKCHWRSVEFATSISSLLVIRTRNRRFVEDIRKKILSVSVIPFSLSLSLSDSVSLPRFVLAFSFGRSATR